MTYTMIPNRLPVVAYTKVKDPDMWNNSNEKNNVRIYDKINNKKNMYYRQASDYGQAH